MPVKTAKKSKTVSIQGQSGPIVSGTATKEKITPEQKATITPQLKSAEIAKEKANGELLRKRTEGKSWRVTQKGGTFLTGQDTGVLAWLTPMLCQFFGLVDCGYRKNFRIWNFPPSLEKPSGRYRHEIGRQYYFKIEGKYLLVDVFDSGTAKAKITLIKAWMEALGYAYTYVLGSDFEEMAKDEAKFSKLIFIDRLTPIDTKAKDYPKFTIPARPSEAGVH